MGDSVSFVCVVLRLVFVENIWFALARTIVCVLLVVLNVRVNLLSTGLARVPVPLG